MTANPRRFLGLFAVLLAAQGSGACNGMRLGNGPDSGATAVPAAAAPATATPATAAAADENPCVSSKCHTTILSQKNVHDAAEGCTDCHSEISTPHPVKGQKTFELLNTVPDLCSTCHDEYGKKKTVHSPVGDGDCMECHDPHSTAEEHLLKKPQGEVCAECHETIASSKVVHGPVSDGDCTSCHDPHETDTASLLVGEFSSALYVPWTDTAYPLCFSCHDRKMVTERESDDVTGFRDGEKNLHSAHVLLDDKGRSCRFCHEVHGSDHPKLIPDSVPFGKWKFGMKYVKTDTGGSCAPACHKVEYYDRDSPGRKPPGARTRAASGY